MGSLANLKELDLRENHIKVLPATFTQLTNLKSLKLDGNPWRFPPLEVADKGMEVSALAAHDAGPSLAHSDTDPQAREGCALLEQYAGVILTLASSCTCLCPFPLPLPSPSRL